MKDQGDPELMHHNYPLCQTSKLPRDFFAMFKVLQDPILMLYRWKKSAIFPYAIGSICFSIYAVVQSCGVPRLHANVTYLDCEFISWEHHANKRPQWRKDASTSVMGWPLQFNLNSLDNIWIFDSCNMSIAYLQELSTRNQTEAIGMMDELQ